MPILHNVPFADYLRMPGAHFSTLRRMAVSPLHYRLACENESVDTPSTIMGRLAHALILTPDLPVDYLVFEGKVRRGKAWDEFVRMAEEEGRPIVQQSQLDAARRMRDAVYRNSHARDLLRYGQGEVTIAWDEEETSTPWPRTVPCRARVDFLSDLGSIVELKTTRYISTSSWAREVVTRHYHAQIAMYRNGLLAHDFAAQPASWIVVENGPPYDVAVYRVGEDTIERGASLVQGWLRRLAECEATGTWPGVGGDGPQDFKLPDYAAADGAPDDVDTSGIEGQASDGG